MTSTVLKSAMEADTTLVLLKPLLFLVDKEENEDEKDIELRKERLEQSGTFLVEGNDDATQLHL